MENANLVNTPLARETRLDNISNDTEADQMPKMLKMPKMPKMPKMLKMLKMLKMPMWSKHYTNHWSGVSCTPLKQLSPISYLL
jgi:hypothetical protein